MRPRLFLHELEEAGAWPILNRAGRVLPTYPNEESGIQVNPARDILNEND